MITSRRQFLQSSSLFSLSPLVPGFINQLAAATNSETDQSILVVVELNGGNDGINTVIPFSNEAYEVNRPTLKAAAMDAHKIDDTLALHRSMRGAKELYDDGSLAIVQGVSYPNPNRSHFESMSIWHSADLSGERNNAMGWIGQALDATRDAKAIGMDGYFIGAQSVPLAMLSRRAQIGALSRFVDLQIDPLVKPSVFPGETADIAAFVNRQRAAALVTSDKLKAVTAADSTGASFPDTPLATKLKLVSQLMQSGSAARVYYAVQEGYDTHSGQRGSHGRLLNEFSGAIKSFFDDLRQHELADRVVLMAFSEFGRRVKENGSQGTDHGSAAPVFLAGPRIQGGLFGNAPDLSDLVDGDIKTQFDFRQIYATILDQWLGISPSTLFESEFEQLDLI